MMNFAMALACVSSWVNQGATLLKVDFQEKHFYIGMERCGRSDEECDKLARQMKVDLTVTTGNPIKTSYKVFETAEELNNELAKYKSWLDAEIAKLGGNK